jgi:hypothetical protein
MNRRCGDSRRFQRDCRSGLAFLANLNGPGLLSTVSEHPDTPPMTENVLVFVGRALRSRGLRGTRDSQQAVDVRGAENGVQQPAVGCRFTSGVSPKWISSTGLSRLRSSRESNTNWVVLNEAYCEMGRKCIVAYKGMPPAHEAFRWNFLYGTENGA